MRFVNYLVYVLAMFIALSGVAYAASAVGASSIVFTSPNVTTNPSSFALVGYDVKLTSGSAGNTSLTVTNLAQLNDSGINVTLTAASGTPPFSGDIFVLTSNNTHDGTYPITLSASGADPSQQSVTVDLVVGNLPPNLNSSTISTTSVAVTTASGTSSSSGSSTLTLVYAIVVIIIIIIVVWFAFSMRRMKNKGGR